MNRSDEHQPIPSIEPPASVLLRGRALRFVLVDELRQRETMTVAEMVAVLADYGYELGGRASKVISDALRWELARDRVRRLGRGVYRYHRAPVSTARRIRVFAERCRVWLVAPMRTEQPKETLRHDQTQYHRTPYHQTQYHQGSASRGRRSDQTAMGTPRMALDHLT